MAEHRRTGSETPPPYAPESSRFGSEPPSVEYAVDVWHYAILELHARNDDDDDVYCLVIVIDRVKSLLLNIITSL